MVAPAYFSIGTGERFHLGEPLPVGSFSVERVEGEAGLDDGRRSDEEDGGGGGQQAGADQACPCEHVGTRFRFTG
jgi:hypothetical protein